MIGAGTSFVRKESFGDGQGAADAHETTAADATFVSAEAFITVPPAHDSWYKVGRWHLNKS